MEIVQVGRREFAGFVDSLVQEKTPEIIGVVRKEGRFAYERIGHGSELCLDYDETVLSPKKYLLPPRESLVEFVPRDAKTYNPIFDTTPRIIIGIHPGDLTAIALLDKAFSEGKVDEHYLLRREHTLLIGMYPTVPWAYRFTRSMIAPGDPYRAADLMMIDMGDDTWAIEIVTDAGKALIARSGATAATIRVSAEIDRRKNAVPDGLTMKVAQSELPAFLDGREHDEIFEARGKKCFSCGSCVMVCPTCFCFEVRDEVELTLDKGRRERSWDGCVLESFADVAGGHNFRKSASDRIRHRVFRKGKYLPERFGITGCVGCGRCIRACTADIASPVDIVNDLLEGK